MISDILFNMASIHSFTKGDISLSFSGENIELITCRWRSHIAPIVRKRLTVLSLCARKILGRAREWNDKNQRPKLYTSVESLQRFHRLNHIDESVVVLILKMILSTINFYIDQKRTDMKDLECHAVWNNDNDHRLFIDRYQSNR